MNNINNNVGQQTTKKEEEPNCYRWTIFKITNNNRMRDQQNCTIALSQYYNGTTTAKINEATNGRRIAFDSFKKLKIHRGKNCHFILYS